MLKTSILPLAFALAIGISVSASAGPQPVSGTPGGYNTEPITAGSTSGTGVASDPFTTAPGLGTGARQKPATSDASDTANDTGDDSLTRLKTSDSLAAGSMGRDEGQLTAKRLRKEKVLHVESAKQLPTSGTDPKFQGSLLHSSVTSIEDIGDKANAETEVQDESDPRFKAKRLVFNPAAEDESKTNKKESPRTKADSSPSPSPSASVSATPSSN